jgi:membrane-anchored glycerophosphoryl diester phosphodiesterase (GDPDase)
MRISTKTIFLVSFLLILFLPIISGAIEGDSTELCKFTKNIKNVLYNIAITIVIIGWVVAGILYLTSMGDQTKMGIAKSAFKAAIIGTVIVVLAWTATNLIADTLKPGGLIQGGCV